MLNIRFGEMPEAIYNTAVFFKNTYQPKWLTDPFAMKMMEDVDRSHVVGGQVIDSPVLGMITPLQLSGGLKTLLLIANDKSGKHVFNASTCGDNCAKWLLQMSASRKVLINLRHMMDFGRESFRIRVVNTGKIVKNMAELLEEAGDFI